jgi:hypothetical protein
MKTEHGCWEHSTREGVEKRENERGTGGVRNCFVRVWGYVGNLVRYTGTQHKMVLVKLNREE